MHWLSHLDALATNVDMDLAYALMSQKSCPSLGYEALNQDEPATTSGKAHARRAVPKTTEVRVLAMIGGGRGGQKRGLRRKGKER